MHHSQTVRVKLFTKDKIYYITTRCVVQLFLVLIPVFANDFSINTGNNLLSYPFKVGQTFEDAIPQQYLDSFSAIAGDGNSKQYIDGHWYGSLNVFNPNGKYWFSTNNSFEFSFNEPDDNTISYTDSDFRDNTPELFTFNQSLYQAFYFIKDADIDAI